MSLIHLTAVFETEPVIFFAVIFFILEEYLFIFEITKESWTHSF